VFLEQPAGSPMPKSSDVNSPTGTSLGASLKAALAK
jgi:hypothetical protein